MSFSKATSPPDDFGSAAEEPEKDFAGALHEVSNTLTVLLGWLDVAYAKAAPGAVREAIEVARTHAHLGYRVARRAIGANVPQESLERSAASLARTAVLGVEPQAQRCGVRIQMDRPDGPDVSVRDVTPALQILTNLLLNAIAFSPKGSVITVRHGARADAAVFGVSDSGSGIDPSRIHTLFSGPESTRSGGAGLGLRHSSALAASKGGELRLTRSSPGAEFELCWPTVMSSTATRQRPLAVAAIAGSRILVIEDDPAVRSLIELTLEARGASTLVVPNLDEFERVAKGRAVFDVALVDLSPLGPDVGQAMRTLRRSSPDLRIIVISGSTAALPQEVEAELSGWVRKPFEMDEVITIVATALGRSRGSTPAAQSAR